MGKQVGADTADDAVRRRAATLSDVAQRAGVSKMAASLVLNGSRSNTRVSEATRQRIRQAAESLGYVPNAVARSLSRRRTNIIAVFLEGAMTPRDLFFSEILSGLYQGCHESERDLLVYGAFRDDSTEDAYATLADGRIDGLILLSQRGSALCHLLKVCQLPIIAIVDAAESLPSVVVDDAGGGRLQAERLAERGHRRVGYLTLPRDQEPVSVMRRRQAFLMAAEERDMVVEETIIPLGSGIRPEDRESLLKQARAGGWTAVVGWADHVAYAFLEGCRVCGMAVPDEMAVIGYDGIPLPYRLAEDMTTVVAPWAEMAHVAVNVLVQRIDGASVASETVLPVRLHEGRTA